MNGRQLKSIGSFALVVSAFISPAVAQTDTGDHVPGQLIVGMKSGMGISAKSEAAKFGGSMAKEIKGEAILLQFPSDKAADAAAKALRRLREVGFVERNGISRIPPVIKNGPAIRTQSGPGAMSVSPDAGTGYQWHHTVIRRTATFTDPLAASLPTVAVIDTGVDYNHPDLSTAGKVIKGKNTVGNNLDPYDDNGHGTHVAGIIAATGANGQYGEGVCPACKIYAVKVLSSAGSGTWFDIAEGMKDVIAKKTTHNIKVANMSLGGGSSTLIGAQVLAMKTAGIALAVAAGNSNTTSITNAWPGADPNAAFRVMATEQNDCRAYFSNYNTAAAPNTFNIAAPGWHILSTTPDASFQQFSGTSMATPVVAGAVALVWGKFPADTLAALTTRTLNASATTSCGFNSVTKRLNLAKAMGVTETGIVGRLLDPNTGKAVSPQNTATTAQLLSGATLLGSANTNKGGFYEKMGLAAGTARTLKGVKTGAVTNSYLRNGIAATTGVVSGPFTDAFPVSRAAGNVTITSDWKSTQPVFPLATCTTACKLGWELDIEIRLPNGTWITPYANSGDLLTTPFVSIPRDSYDDSEPVETAIVGSAAANGTYQVWVANWGDGLVDNGLNFGFNRVWAGSGASVQIFNGASKLGTPDQYQPVHSSCAILGNAAWYVGNLVKSGTSYTWTAVNTCAPL